MGLSDTQIAHLGDDTLADGLFDTRQASIVRFARRSTLMEPIDDALFAELAASFDTRQLIELCFTVGISNLVNRFHALFRTPLDAHTSTVLAASCPLDLPPAPTG